MVTKRKKSEASAPPAPSLYVSEPEVLAAVALSLKPVSFEFLKRILNVRNEDAERELHTHLSTLIEKKSINITGKNSALFRASEDLNASDLMVARITTIHKQQTSSGQTTVTKADLEPITWKQDYPPPRLTLKGSYAIRLGLQEGDKALIKLTRFSGAKNSRPLDMSCQVKQRLEPGQSAQITGTFHQQSNQRTLTPDTGRKTTQRTFPVNKVKTRKLHRTGDKVIGSINEEFCQSAPHVDIDSLIWTEGQQSTQLSTAVLIEHGKRIGYDNRIESSIRNTVKSFNEGDYKNEREIEFISIDGSDAQDCDDAIYAIPDPDNAEGWIVKVAVAHAAAYVPVGSPQDKRAMQDPFSIFTFDNAIHMLGPYLAQDVCSLKENTKRPAIVGTFRIDSEGRVLDRNFERSIIKNRHQLSYDLCDLALDLSDTYPSHIQRLIDHLNHAYQAIALSHDNRGDLSFIENKIVPHFDNNHTIKGFTTERDSLSRDIVKKFMILFGEQLGDYLHEHGVDHITRNQAPPSPAAIRKLRRNLEGLGLKCPEHDNWDQMDIRDIQAQTQHNSVLAKTVSDLILFRMNSGEYGLNKAGHFSMGIDENYATGTSSIRRYADIINHRALGRAQGWYMGPLIENESENTFRLTIDNLTAAEREANAIQANILKRYGIDYLMRTTQSSDFKTQARTTSLIPNNGLEVEIADCPVPFHFPFKDMPKGNYITNWNRLSLYNERTQTTYRLGEEIDIELSHINPLDQSLHIRMQGDTTRTHKHNKKPSKQTKEAKAAFKVSNTSPAAKLKALNAKATILSATQTGGLHLSVTPQETDNNTAYEIQLTMKDMPAGNYKTTASKGLYHYQSKRTFEPGQEIDIRLHIDKSGAIQHVTLASQNSKTKRKKIPSTQTPKLTSFSELGDLLFPNAE